MNISNLNVSRDLFKAEKRGDILVLTFREKPLLHVADLSAKKALFDYLDLVSDCDEVKALLIREAPTKMKRKEYIAFYKTMIGPGFDQVPLERMYNAIGQFILKLAALDKVVVHADSGEVILLFMNVGLACDFRIVAEDTVYRNPNVELGLVPKGGSVFFLSRMLGTAAAAQLLFSGKDVDAGRARAMGLVDKVVPGGKLDQAALEMTRSCARIPTGYAVGVKRLLNHDLAALGDFLELENALLRRVVRRGPASGFG